ncbi:hypothetical protein [Candidatus Hakubella thermalkaliphila]|uniref:hypothetical protein n=1 Tax=Candidatus Hakubella thermalkaliphila TaxID=2754717 RepID=UPI0015942ED4|nr:hypothetical protein [Candidatus Hakubella thermalkaliphila]
MDALLLKAPMASFPMLSLSLFCQRGGGRRRQEGHRLAARRAGNQPEQAGGQQADEDAVSDVQGRFRGLLPDIKKG